MAVCTRCAAAGRLPTLARHGTVQAEHHTAWARTGIRWPLQVRPDDQARLQLHRAWSWCCIGSVYPVVRVGRL